MSLSSEERTKDLLKLWYGAVFARYKHKLHPWKITENLIEMKTMMVDEARKYPLVEVGKETELKISHFLLKRLNHFFREQSEAFAPPALEHDCFSDFDSSSDESDTESNSDLRPRSL